MDMTNEEYKNYAKQHSKNSPILKNCLKAFFIGGLICSLGQSFTELYSKYFDLTLSRACSSVTLIIIAIILTGFDLFDELAKFGGAGTLVPITGFANAVVSPAIDNKAEGWILGVGSKIFIIAGPVILYGTLASVIYGIIYYIFLLIK